MVRKLKYIPYGQAWVRDYADIGKDKRVLQSYETDVVIVNEGWISCTGLYSMTTRKHISAFLREYYPAISFQTIKTLAQTGDSMDILTGEVVRH